MQFLNRTLRSRQQVGHINLFEHNAFIEVPERDANRVMKALTGSLYKNKEVRCNEADDNMKGNGNASKRRSGRDNDRNRGEKRGNGRDQMFEKPKKGKRKGDVFADNGEEMGDWRQFFSKKDVKLRGEEPDFSEEGWARRRSRKK